MASIDDWNVAPNKQYFVKIIDTGSQVKVFLYNTQAYATAGSHLVASGICAYGTEQSITLSNKAEYPTIGYFNNSKAYHLKVTFAALEATVTFKVGPFYDKDINDILCHTATMQADRAAVEINRGTHTIDTKSLILNTHDENMRDGLVATLNTDKFTSQDHMIKRVTIRGNPDGTILDELEVYKYEDLTLY